MSAWQGSGLQKQAQPLSDQLAAYVARGEVADGYPIFDVPAVVADGVRRVLPGPWVALFPNPGCQFVQLRVIGGLVQRLGM